jgi:hypothetical protein
VVVLCAIHEMKNFGFKIQFGCSSFLWHAFDFTVHIKGKFISMHTHHLSMRVGDVKADLNAW